MASGDEEDDGSYEVIDDDFDDESDYQSTPESEGSDQELQEVEIPAVRPLSPIRSPQNSEPEEQQGSVDLAAQGSDRSHFTIKDSDDMDIQVDERSHSSFDFAERSPDARTESDEDERPAPGSVVSPPASSQSSYRSTEEAKDGTASQEGSARDAASNAAADDVAASPREDARAEGNRAADSARGSAASVESRRVGSASAHSDSKGSNEHSAASGDVNNLHADDAGATSTRITSDSNAGGQHEAEDNVAVSSAFEPSLDRDVDCTTAEHEAAVDARPDFTRKAGNSDVGCQDDAEDNAVASSANEASLDRAADCKTAEYAAAEDVGLASNIMTSNSNAVGQNDTEDNVVASSANAASSDRAVDCKTAEHEAAGEAGPAFPRITSNSNAGGQHDAEDNVAASSANAVSLDRAVDHKTAEHEAAGDAHLASTRIASNSNTGGQNDAENNVAASSANEASLGGAVDCNTAESELAETDVADSCPAHSDAVDYEAASGAADEPDNAPWNSSGVNRPRQGVGRMRLDEGAATDLELFRQEHLPSYDFKGDTTPAKPGITTAEVHVKARQRATATFSEAPDHPTDANQDAALDHPTDANQDAAEALTPPSRWLNAEAAQDLVSYRMEHRESLGDPILPDLAAEVATSEMVVADERLGQDADAAKRNSIVSEAAAADEMVTAHEHLNHDNAARNATVSETTAGELAVADECLSHDNAVRSSAADLDAAQIRAREEPASDRDAVAPAEAASAPVRASEAVSPAEVASAPVNASEVVSPAERAAAKPSAELVDALKSLPVQVIARQRAVAAQKDEGVTAKDVADTAIEAAIFETMPGLASPGSDDLPNQEPDDEGPVFQGAREAEGFQAIPEYTTVVERAEGAESLLTPEVKTAVERVKGVEAQQALPEKIAGAQENDPRAPPAVTLAADRAMETDGLRAPQASAMAAEASQEVEALQTRPEDMRKSYHEASEDEQLPEGAPLSPQEEEELSDETDSEAPLNVSWRRTTLKDLKDGEKKPREVAQKPKGEKPKRKAKRKTTRRKTIRSAEKDAVRAAKSEYRGSVVLGSDAARRLVYSVAAKEGIDGDNGNATADGASAAAVTAENAEFDERGLEEIDVTDGAKQDGIPGPENQFLVPQLLGGERPKSSTRIKAAPLFRSTGACVNLAKRASVWKGIEGNAADEEADTADQEDDLVTEGDAWQNIWKNRRRRSSFEGRKLSPRSILRAQKGGQRRSAMQTEADLFLSHLRERGDGSVGIAWRRYFDTDGDGALSFNEFCNALVTVDYRHDAVALWRQFGGETSTTLGLEVLDQESATVIEFFREWCVKNMGGPLEMFYAFDDDASDCLQPDELVDGLTEWGFFQEPGIPPSIDTAEKLMRTLYPLLDRNDCGALQPEELLFLEIDPEKKHKHELAIKRRREGIIAAAEEVPNEALELLKGVAWETTRQGKRHWKMVKHPLIGGDTVSPTTSSSKRSGSATLGSSKRSGSATFGSGTLTLSGASGASRKRTPRFLREFREAKSVAQSGALRSPTGVPPPIPAAPRNKHQERRDLVAENAGLGRTRSAPSGLGSPGVLDLREGWRATPAQAQELRPQSATQGRTEKALRPGSPAHIEGALQQGSDGAAGPEEVAGLGQAWAMSVQRSPKRNTAAWQRAAVESQKSRDRYKTYGASLVPRLQQPQRSRPGRCSTQPIRRQGAMRCSSEATLFDPQRLDSFLVNTKSRGLCEHYGVT